MSDQFIGEVRLFPGDFAPQGWAFCDGQLLQISQNTALFAVLGTTYGGDGRTTFGLPNIQGRAPMHPGNGPGLTPRRLAETGGVETVTLSDSQMPSHTHQLVGDGNDGDSTNPQNNYIGTGNQLFNPPAALGAMESQSLPDAGGGQPHNNMHPYLTLNFIIALEGDFPNS